MTQKIKLTQEQTDFLKQNGTVYNHGYEEAIFLPFIYTRDPEDDKENVYDLILISEVNSEQLRLLGINNLFTLEQMKDCALAMANWGDGFKNALTPKEYFKQELGIDL